MTELEKLRDECLKCKKCSIGGIMIGYPDAHISNVFSTMNPSARIMVVGQNPGINEVAQGIPFVGVSGKFFDQMANDVLGMSRSDFYVSNTARCYTPGNRPPTTTEMENCRSFLDREIAIVNPLAVIALGSPAFKWLTGMSGITKHHGQLIFSPRYRVNILPLYHPSPLNMNSEEKRNMFREGLKVLKGVLNG